MSRPQGPQTKSPQPNLRRTKCLAAGSREPSERSRVRHVLRDRSTTPLPYLGSVDRPLTSLFPAASHHPLPVRECSRTFDNLLESWLAMQRETPPDRVQLAGRVFGPP